MKRQPNHLNKYLLSNIYGLPLYMCCSFLMFFFLFLRKKKKNTHLYVKTICDLHIEFVLNSHGKLTLKLKFVSVFSLSFLKIIVLKKGLISNAA